MCLVLDVVNYKCFTCASILVVGFVLCLVIVVVSVRVPGGESMVVGERVSSIDKRKEEPNYITM